MYRLYLAVIRDFLVCNVSWEYGSDSTVDSVNNTFQAVDLDLIPGQSKQTLPFLMGQIDYVPGRAGDGANKLRFICCSFQINEDTT